RPGGSALGSDGNEKRSRNTYRATRGSFPIHGPPARKERLSAQRRSRRWTSRSPLGDLQGVLEWRRFRAAFLPTLLPVRAHAFRGASILAEFELEWRPFANVQLDVFIAKEFVRLNVIVEVELVVVREAREPQDVVFVHFAEYNMWW